MPRKGSHQGKREPKVDGHGWVHESIRSKTPSAGEQEVNCRRSRRQGRARALLGGIAASTQGTPLQMPRRG